MPAAQRFAYWQGIFADANLSMAIEGEPEAFDGIFTRLTAGELELTSVKSSPLTTRRGASAATDEGFFSLQLVHSGRCLLRHAGTEIVAETGDMIVVDARRPYELAFKQSVHGLVLSLPWARLAAMPTRSRSWPAGG